MLFAYANAATIKITFLLRKAYGGAYIAMCSKHLGADSVYSWPIAEIAVLGAESAVSIIHRKELSKLPENERTEKRQIYINEYKEKYMNSMLAMKEGYIDEEIQPNETRNILINDLNSFADKKSYIILNKKHGNITL
uniref:carboxyl transferase domain-containing protein n=1 Tax=Enterocloster clostridioformis TaxID=1531 RepID=UPI001C3D61F5|nr:carboxyl transferase domain-containing protein [Enterocloster clostridioformis]